MRASLSRGLLALALAACAPQGGANAPDAEEPSVLAEAGVFRHPAGVLVEVPAGWRLSRTDDTMSLLSPDDGVLMMLFMVEAEELQIALRAMDKTIARYLSEATVRNTRETTMNGMPAIVADGHGTMGKDRVEVGIALALSPIGKVLIVLGLARRSAPPERQQEVQRIIKSIRPEGA